MVAHRVANGCDSIFRLLGCCERNFLLLGTFPACYGHALALFFRTRLGCVVWELFHAGGVAVVLGVMSDSSSTSATVSASASSHERSDIAGQLVTREELLALKKELLLKIEAGSKERLDSVCVCSALLTSAKSVLEDSKTTNQEAKSRADAAVSDYDRAKALLTQTETLLTSADGHKEKLEKLCKCLEDLYSKACGSRTKVHDQRTLVNEDLKELNALGDTLRTTRSQLESLDTASRAKCAELQVFINGWNEQLQSISYKIFSLQQQLAAGPGAAPVSVSGSMWSVPLGGQPYGFPPPPPPPLLLHLLLLLHLRYLLSFLRWLRSPLLLPLPQCRPLGWRYREA
jgi:hypothetical protein